MDVDQRTDARQAAGYTRRQRYTILAAVAVLALMMGGVTFAAGVYVGNNRELAPGTAPGPGGGPGGGPQRFGQGNVPGQGPGQGAGPAVPGAQQNPGVLPQGGQVAPNAGGANPGSVQRPFDVVGSITAMNGATIELTMPDGKRIVALDPQTRYQQDDGGQVSQGSLRLNAIVGVVLRPGGGNVVDQLVVITGRPRNTQRN